MAHRVGPRAARSSGSVECDQMPVQGSVRSWEGGDCATEPCEKHVCCGQGQEVGGKKWKSLDSSAVVGLAGGNPITSVNLMLFVEKKTTMK